MIIRGNTVGTNMSVKRIAEKIATPPLMVTIDYDTNKASHTAVEIMDHMSLGGQAFIAEDGQYVAITTANHSYAFANVSIDATRLAGYYIDDEGKVTTSVTELATADQIGDISSALDELHTYAQGLIDGGGSV